ncbi:MAG TPA: SAM-dependent chlorinase/fluorinase [Pyrinomonadaceae bacterium]|nr:SAM-dependent chlorinase/fluorinase [Pyrinomonadaceae bacterium]
MIVTLLTDFGGADYFVGAMKGAILSADPRAVLVDLTHEIPPFDVEAAAYTLLAACEAFPPGTVHAAVVDPGVGSERRALAAECAGHFFVGPDNGLFSYAFERGRGAPRVFHLTNREYFRQSVSTTFHGRDVFAPVAGTLSAGVALDELGEEIADWVRLAPLAPARAADGSLEARVIHVDRYGNCVANVTRAELTDEQIARGLRVEAGGHIVTDFRRFFADAADETGAPFAFWGSAGFLELAAFRDSAARLLQLTRGQAIRVTVKN